LREFEFHQPTSLEDALALLREGGSAAVAKAGGTDLLVLMRQEALAPRIVVGLSRVGPLRGVRRLNGSLRIGACTTAAAIESDPLIATHARGLTDAAERMATVQIRNLATVGGNLASAAACGDFAPVLIALHARARLRSASGARELPLADCFTGPRTTVLARGELITDIEVPEGGPGSGSAYVKFGYRGGAQIAVVSAAARVVQENGKAREVDLVLGAVAPVPFRVKGASVLRGRAIEGAALDAACAAAASECAPISDIRGSEAYRRAVASVIARKALELAWQRSLMHAA
jgi:carbon-monoxide dehydrogenase medium subunit